jgi:PTH1 family peptidyl-tRNA hydrolase
MSVSVIAGLGNPGKSYQDTRHNVGFQVVDAYVEKLGGSWKEEAKFLSTIYTWKRGPRKVHFVKPQTFMNLSGDALSKLLNYFKIPLEELAVVYDDINLDLGRLKINQDGGAGGHNGIDDLFNKLGRRFIRFRVGLGGKYPPEIDLADFVLGKFSKSETDVIKQQMDHYHQALDLLLHRGVTIAMNQFNKRKAKHDADQTNL